MSEVHILELLVLVGTLLGTVFGVYIGYLYATLPKEDERGEEQHY